MKPEDMVGTRVKCWGELKNGTRNHYSGHLDCIIQTPVGIIAIVDRLPVYDAYNFTSNPSRFERDWINH
jgi:hypothetical protein